MSKIEEAMQKAVLLREGQEKQQIPIVPTEVGVIASESRHRNDMESFEKPITRITSNNPYLVALNAPNSPIAEEYRKLKESLVKQTRGERFLNTIMVTSPLVGEGKTITSLNLSICLAQELDHTVLLIDADLRRPSCTKYLGLVAESGLTECLTKGLDVGEALLKTDVGKLSILPAGSVASNPAELFSSKAMHNLLMEIKHRYTDRFVIIDTPPVLPFAETRTMGTIVDGILLVIKESLSSRENIQDSLDGLRGSNVLGAVYNHAELNPMTSSYYYYQYNQ